MTVTNVTMVERLANEKSLHRGFGSDTYGGTLSLGRNWLTSSHLQIQTGCKELHPLLFHFTESAFSCVCFSCIYNRNYFLDIRVKTHGVMP